jgi:hypothetical protein
MPDFVESPILGGLWLIAFIVLIWACVPSLMHVLGLSQHTQRSETAPKDLTPNDAEPDYDDAYQQLTALGFRPLGAFRERLWFFYFHWSKSFRTRVFIHPERHCYACAYRLARERVRVSFATCFSDDSLIWSSDSLEAYQLGDDDWIRWGFVTDDLAQLWALHQEVVDKYRRPCREVDARDDLSTLLNLIGKVNGRYVRQDRGRAGRMLKTSVLSLGICPIVAAFIHGLGHWMVPCGVLAGGLGWAGFHFLWPRVVGMKRKVELAQGQAVKS